MGMVSDRGHDSGSFSDQAESYGGVFMGVKWVLMGVINTVQLWKRIHFILVC